MIKFTFETELGELLQGECSVICRDSDGADAETDEVSLLSEDGQRFIEPNELSKPDQARLERTLQDIADENAIEAFTEYQIGRAEAAWEASEER